jgi:hypothetical protein
MLIDRQPSQDDRAAGRLPCGDTSPIVLVAWHGGRVRPHGARVINTWVRTVLPGTYRTVDLTSSHAVL